MNIPKRLVCCVYFILSFSSCSDGLKDTQDIREVNNIKELFNIEETSILNELHAIEGKDLAIAQAKKWNVNADLIGVSCPKYRITDNDSELCNEPILWLYLFKEKDPQKWLAVTIVKTNTPIVFDVGYKVLKYGNLNDWYPIQNNWLIDPVFNEFPQSELAGYKIDDDIIPIWFHSQARHSTQAKKTWRIAWIATNATNGVKIENDDIISLALQQRSNRTDLNDKLTYVDTLEPHEIEDYQKSLNEEAPPKVVYKAYSPGSVVTQKIFSYNKTLFLNENTQ